MVYNPFLTADKIRGSGKKEGNMSIQDLFNDHPSSVGETYLEHMRMALGFAVTLTGAALAALIHAFLPFLFVRTGSRCITELHDRMVTNRVRASGSEQAQVAGN